MSWVIESVKDNSRLFRGRTFSSYELAQTMLTQTMPGLESHFRVIPENLNQISPKGLRMLREGMVKGDLRGILLPILSVDQYMPADPKTDNIVIAFYIKGVPEAVLPVKNYIDHCDGVVDVDYGDSENIPNCSIVYAELVRDKLNVEHIHMMVRDMARLANIESDDFTVSFPTSDDKFPYRPEIVDQYFQLRTEDENQRAQDEAIAASGNSTVDQRSPEQQITDESVMIQRLVSLFG